MASYRLTHSAQADIVSILAWSEVQFGEDARKRYELLIAAAIRGASSRTDEVGQMPRPELGGGVFSWHLSQSRIDSLEGAVRRPRHFLLCRQAGDMLIVGRVLHDAMDLQRQVDSERLWG